jgi:Lectin C-type domain
MNLVAISSFDEYENFIKIAYDNPSMFKDEIFVSTNSVFFVETGFMCMTYSKLSPREFPFRGIESNDQQSKFLCESVEFSNSFEPKEIREIVNVKPTFFRPLSVDNFKKYYLSRVALTPPAASMACKSFGMNLASPKNQAEYNTLQNLLADLLVPSSAAIAVFRSSADKNIWLDGDGNTKNYKIPWYDDSSWDATTNENCAVFTPLTDSPMTDVSCNTAYAFVCEDSEYTFFLGANSIYDQQEAEKFMDTLTSVTVDTSKFDFGFSKSSIKLSFFDAKLLCQSLQMELFTPDQLLYDEIIKEVLVNIEGESTFITGMTSMGSLDTWYSVVNGKVLDDVIKWSDDEFISECSALVKSSQGELYYKDVDCSEKNNFICLKTSTVDNLKYDYVANDYVELKEGTTSQEI